MSINKVDAEIIKKAKKIKIIFLDVDGVMTDGGIIVDDDGVESKNFFVRDGLAIVVAIKKGIKFAVISGRYSKVVELRMSELGIHDVHQNAMNKVKVFESILAKQNLMAGDAAFIGDDVNDLGVLEIVGLSAAPADADETVKSQVNMVCNSGGGKGAVREMIELILTEQGKWDY